MTEMNKTGKLPCGHEPGCPYTLTVKGQDCEECNKPTIADYEEVLADHRRLVRALDVAMHGEDGAAKQASLVDLIGPAEDMRAELIELRKSVKIIALAHVLAVERGERLEDAPSPDPTSKAGRIAEAGVSGQLRTDDILHNVKARIQAIEHMSFPRYVPCEYTDKERWDLVLGELRWIMRMFDQLLTPAACKTYALLEKEFMPLLRSFDKFQDSGPCWIESLAPQPTTVIAASNGYKLLCRVFNRLNERPGLYPGIPEALNLVGGILEAFDMEIL